MGFRCLLLGHKVRQITGFRNLDGAAIGFCERCHTPINHARLYGSESLGIQIERAARVQGALLLAGEYGQIDGGHHRLWVIDQMVRAITGDKYDEWVEAQCEGGEYSWDVGIPP